MEEDTAHRPPEQNTANAFALTDAVKLLSTAISTQFQQLTEKLQEDNKSSAQQLSKKLKENIAGKLKYEGNKDGRRIPCWVENRTGIPMQ